jgi:hypothetical protein
MKDFRMQPAACPHCGAVHDGAASAEGNDRPQAGDVSVCIKCAGLMCFAHDMTLRRLVLEDYEELFADTSACGRLLTVRDLIRKMREQT